MASSPIVSVLLALAIATPLSWARSTAQAPNKTLDDYYGDKVAKKEAAAAAAAIEAKMAAVDKVIAMMEEIKAKVTKEGDDEAALYDKFACFCKDTQKEKTDAIAEGTDSQTTLDTAIKKLAGERDGLDTAIGGLEADIALLTKEMKTEKAKRASTNAVYSTNEEDTSGAIFALEKAIQSLKASKSPASASLVQIQNVANTVRTAMMLADALGLIRAEDKKVASLFLQSADGQAPEVEMEDYKFHSDDIIGTLEKLLKDFKATKVSLDTEEVASVQAFQMLMQTKTDTMKAKKLELENSQAMKAAKVASIAEKSEELSVTSSTLLDDQQYLMQLNTLCADKAKTWDQRNKVRGEELFTLTTVIGILKDQVKTNTSAVTMRLVQQGPAKINSAKINFGVFAAAQTAQSQNDMEAIEAVAEMDDAEDDAPVGFLQRKQQRRSVQPHGKMNGRLAVSAMLRSEGAKLKSTLLTALASQLQNSEDPFAKIKGMIQALIDKLLAEESSEANKKGYCDKNIADSTQKRTYAAEKVDELNAKLAEAEATRDTLAEEIGVLNVDILKLNGMQADADADRSAESSTNAATVAEAEAGLAAIKEAIDIIDQFYKTKLLKEKVFVQAPEDDAPDAGFKNFEAYKGSQAEAGGVIGMMDVIKSDFERTIADTQAAEAAAKMEHLEFTTATQKSIKTKETAESQKSKIKGEVDSTILEDKASLGAQMTILQTAVTELIAWKAECIDTGMTYNKRVENREDEIADLKKALCILENYDEYGEGAEATTC
mmetsp:Transcript_90096/g.172656  ORF Transcript_90096/g.172656 Transcript_90096/m.172656 type:complete len:774 (-) Transcript_90096:58-2379(-)